MALSESLLNVNQPQSDTELYALHGPARGGIGTLVATGARAGFIPPQLRSKLKSCSVGSTASRSSLGGVPPSSVPGSGSSTPQHSSVRTSHTSRSEVLKASPRSYPHPRSFTAVARSSRVDDMPSGSRWATLSFYENDPRHIKHHVDVLRSYDQACVAQRQADEAVAAARLSDFKQQQLETFRSQRLAQAARYAQAGVLPRVHFAGGGGGGGGSLDGISETAALRPTPLSTPASFSVGGLPGSRPWFGSTGSTTSSDCGRDSSSRADGDCTGVRAVRSYSAPTSSPRLPARPNTTGSVGGPSHFRVCHRMAEEASQSRMESCQAIRSAAREEAWKKERAELDRTLVDMDRFDDQITAAQSAKKWFQRTRSNRYA